MANTSLSPIERLTSLFDERAQAIAAVIPKGSNLTPETFFRFLLQAAKSDALRACSPESVLEAAMESAALGLTVGGSLAHAYIVPYKGACQFQLGYRGMIELMRRSGGITHAEVRAVFKGDQFSYRFGTNAGIDHAPCGNTNPDDLTHTYVIVYLATGGHQFDVMTRDEILAVMERSPSINGKVSPWKTDPVEMAKKCPVRRIAKIVRMSPELQEAFTRDDERTVDVSARVVVPQTTAPRLPNFASDATTEEAPTGGDEIPGDKIPSDEPPRTPIDDFKIRFAAARTEADLKAIGGKVAEVGLSKNPELVAAYKAAAARIKESVGAAQ